MEEQLLLPGMIAGFIVLPILWFLQEMALRLATSYHWPQINEIRYFISNGALPGAFLGTGISQFILARSRAATSSKRDEVCLFPASCVLLAVAFPPENTFVAFEASVVTNVPSPSATINPGLYKNFAFHCAILMFFIGLLMRSRR